MSKNLFSSITYSRWLKYQIRKSLPKLNQAWSFWSRFMIRLNQMSLATLAICLWDFVCQLQISTAIFGIFLRDFESLKLTFGYVRLASDVSCYLRDVFMWLLMASVTFGICLHDFGHRELSSVDFLFILYDMMTSDVSCNLRDVFVWLLMASVTFGIYLPDFGYLGYLQLIFLYFDMKIYYMILSFTNSCDFIFIFLIYTLPMSKFNRLY